MKSRRIKTHTYAIYQFLSSLALALMLSSLIMGVYYSIINNSPSRWREGTLHVLGFEFKGTLGTVASTIFYVGLLIMFVSWAVAAYSVKAEKRNMWDSLFILFFFIPFLGNVICLIAQLVSKEYEFQSGFVDRKKIKEELIKKNKLEETQRLAKEKLKEKERIPKLVRPSNKGK